jgi:hypothetical protein
MDDRDWLDGDEGIEQGDAVGALLRRNPGCFRRDELLGEQRTFPNLAAATVEPPGSDEAMITDAIGRALALSHSDCAAWVPTRYGVRWRAREIRGLEPTATPSPEEAPLAYCRESFEDDREDFASECDREERRERELAWQEGSS